MGRRAPDRLPRLQSPRSGGAKRIPLRRAKSQPAAPLPERSPLVWPQTQATVWKSLQRRGGRERPLPRGTSQRAAEGRARNAEAARDGDKAPEQRREVSDDREAARRGAAGVPRGAAGCPRGVLPSAAWLFWDPGEGQVPDVPHREILFQTTRLASHSPSNVIPHQAEATETRDTPRRPVLFPPCGRVLSQEGGCGSVPPRHICTERLLRRAIPPSGGGSLNGPQEPEAEECAGCQAHCEAG